MIGGVTVHDGVFTPYSSSFSAPILSALSTTRVSRSELSMRALVFVVLLALATSVSHAAQGIPQLPQIPAFLPMVNTVPASAPSPIDGEWIISTLSKRIRIQSGRAFALDPWLHMFVLQVKPMMVVISEISTTDGQNYVGKDLPLLGTWNASLGPDGNLNVSVQTMVGPVKYSLMPIRLDDRDLFEQAKSGDYGQDEYEDDYDSEYEEDYEYDEEDEYAYEDDYSDDEW